eukprot:m.221647 g.221647  ORF g.221647 m.221647 type:complete len:69 (-) comp33355_c0_seq2:173-379(-)
MHSHKNTNTTKAKQKHTHQHHHKNKHSKAKHNTQNITTTISDARGLTCTARLEAGVCDKYARVRSEVA